MASLGTRLLKIKVGSTEYTSDVSTCEVTSKAADSDFTSFADAATGGAREYAIELTLKQDMVAASLWRLVWASAGTTVAVKINPYGNATATATEPHVTANVTITEPDGTLLGGAANPSTSARMVIKIRWVCTAKPVEVITGTF